MIGKKIVLNSLIALSCLTIFSFTAFHANTSDAVGAEYHSALIVLIGEAHTIGCNTPANTQNPINSSASALTLKWRSQAVSNFLPIISMTMENRPSQIKPVSQPWVLKIAVTIIGLGLIILELWWFLKY